MKLSNQAKGALLMTLQKCLLEEVDVVGLLDELDFTLSDGELCVLNSPTVDLSKTADPLLREGFNALTVTEE